MRMATDCRRPRGVTMPSASTALAPARLVARGPTSARWSTSARRMRCTAGARRGRRGVVRERLRAGRLPRMPEETARVGDVELAYETFGDPSQPALLLV